MSHFTIQELTASDTAIRLGIDNMPPPSVVLNLNVLRDGMDAIRHLLGDVPVKVNSGYRSEALEKVLCAKDFARWCKMHSKESSAWPEYFARKAHPKGYACDFTCSAFGSPAQIVAFLKSTPLRVDQLITEGTWVHVSFDPALRGQYLSATFDKDGVPTYEPLGVA